MSLKRQTFLLPVHFRLIRRPWIRCYLIGMLIASNSEIQTHQSSTGSVKTVKSPTVELNMKVFCESQLPVYPRKKKLRISARFPAERRQKTTKPVLFQKFIRTRIFFPISFGPTTERPWNSKKNPPCEISFDFMKLYSLCCTTTTSISQSVSQWQQQQILLVWIGLPSWVRAVTPSQSLRQYACLPSGDHNPL